jgi:hypothetical protein
MDKTKNEEERQCASCYWFRCEVSVDEDELLCHGGLWWAEISLHQPGYCHYPYRDEEDVGGSKFVDGLWFAVEPRKFETITEWGSVCGAHVTKAEHEAKEKDE